MAHPLSTMNARQLADTRPPQTAYAPRFPTHPVYMPPEQLPYDSQPQHAPLLDNPEPYYPRYGPPSLAPLSPLPTSAPPQTSYIPTGLAMPAPRAPHQHQPAFHALPHDSRPYDEPHHIHPHPHPHPHTGHAHSHPHADDYFVQSYYAAPRLPDRERAYLPDPLSGGYRLRPDPSVTNAPPFSPPAQTFTPAQTQMQMQMAQARQQPSYVGLIRTTQEALKLLAACDLPDTTPGHPPRRIPRRLLDSERAALVRSGNVFVWDEAEAGIRRWTDGRVWSASRVNGCFLTYRELLVRKHRTGAPGCPTQNKYKADGLIKQSFTMTTTSGRKLHIISYYHKRDLRERQLRRVDDDARFTPGWSGAWPIHVDPAEFPDPELNFELNSTDKKRLPEPELLSPVSPDWYDHERTKRARLESYDDRADPMRTSWSGSSRCSAPGPASGASAPSSDASTSESGRPRFGPLSRWSSQTTLVEAKTEPGTDHSAAGALLCLSKDDAAPVVPAAYSHVSVGHAPHPHPHMHAHAHSVHAFA